MKKLEKVPISTYSVIFKLRPGGKNGGKCPQSYVSKKDKSCIQVWGLLSEEFTLIKQHYIYLVKRSFF